MSTNNINKNVIDLILKESKSYTSIELIESFIQEQKSLEYLPLQPLYLTIRSLPIESKTYALKLLSKEQRTIFYDLNLWRKDNLDIEDFSHWVMAIAKSPDSELRFEFSQSTEFQLFLKGRFNIWTFDIEDPQYPEHDNYFLTEDDLLLFEFDSGCHIAPEIKTIIKELYTELGVEKAYQHLFTIISDNFLSFMEEEFQQKNSRLQDIGFVDYYKSLEIENTFPTIKHLNLFIKKKKIVKVKVSSKQKCQAIHPSSLVAFQNDRKSISDELIKVSNTDRCDFLHFNFIRLLNSSMEFFDVLKSGPVAMTRVGKRLRNTISLGLDYIKNHRKFIGDCIFDYFDFTEIYKIGNTLTSDLKKSTLKQLKENNLFENKFVGAILQNYIENILDDQTFIISKESKRIPVSSFEQYITLQENVFLIQDLLPFIKKFRLLSNDLISKKDKEKNNAYLNYDYESIDFEVLLISNFINFCLGHFENPTKKIKIGITINELKKFSSLYIIENNFDHKIQNKIKLFITSFGLSKVTLIYQYIIEIISFSLLGYSFQDMNEKDFSHVGGPLILNIQDHR